MNEHNMILDRGVLDHGFVRHVESWGCGDAGTDYECGIIEAARQSTQGSFRGWAQDEKLLQHLWQFLFKKKLKLKELIECQNLKRKNERLPILKN